MNQHHHKRLPGPCQVNVLGSIIGIGVMPAYGTPRCRRGAYSVICGRMVNRETHSRPNTAAIYLYFENGCTVAFPLLC